MMNAPDVVEGSSDGKLFERLLPLVYICIQALLAILVGGTSAARSSKQRMN